MATPHSVAEASRLRGRPNWRRLALATHLPTPVSLRPHSCPCPQDSESSSSDEEDKKPIAARAKPKAAPAKKAAAAKQQDKSGKAAAAAPKKPAPKRAVSSAGEVRACVGGQPAAAAQGRGRGPRAPVSGSCPAVPSAALRAPRRSPRCALSGAGLAGRRPQAREEGVRPAGADAGDAR